MKHTEDFVKWLEEGKENSETILGVPWDVKVQDIEGDEDRQLVVATHPKIPFQVEVMVTKHYANLVINPRISTDAMELPERMRTYKKLLHLNTELNLMKAGLIGYEDNVIIQADLDLASVSEEEFNDALTLLIVGGQNLISILGLSEELEEFMLQRYKAIIALKLQGGEKEEDILDFLTNRGGLEKEAAQELVDQINEFLKQSSETAEGETHHKSSPGPMYG